MHHNIDSMVAKIKHYLVTIMGRSLEQASDAELYRAFCYALREQIMANWQATYETHNSRHAKTLYYFSLEYLPGRIISNNINNLSAQDLVIGVAHKLGRDWKLILAEERDPGLGNGGLGRLASCFMDSLATHDYPVKGYGLRYQYGIFEQKFKNGQQVEAPDCWLLSEFPWEFRRDLKRVSVKFCGDEDEVWAVPYDVPIVGYKNEGPFSVATLRLWSTKESPRNFRLQRYNAGKFGEAAENTILTDVLYPADYHDAGKRTRIKQEFLLVSASLQDIISHHLKHHNSLDNFVDYVAIQINDTHPALVIPELIRILTSEHGISWNKAVEMTCDVTGYTNHTVMTEALEQWDQDLIQHLLPYQFKVIERLNYEFCGRVRKAFPGDEERIHRMSILEGGQVRMAHLAIAGSHRINGVAELHSHILQKRVFKDFYELFPERFTNVTNGITQRRWLMQCNPALAEMITAKIGDGWKRHLEDLLKFDVFASDPDCQRQFLEIKRNNKEALAMLHPTIEADSLFDVQIKRVHEYKRQLMNALHILMLYNEVKKNPQHGRVKRTFIFSGKAAAAYETAKQVISLILAIGRLINNDRSINNHIKVVYIENYNVSNASRIIPAADISEQISTAGMEASGTGNMKLALNGALTIGTRDGASVEMEEEIGEEWWPFAFGATADEIEAMRAQQCYDPREIYSASPQIKEALDMLKNGALSENEEEERAFGSLFSKLIEGEFVSSPDTYFVLKDLQAYYETQEKVDLLYQQQDQWAEYALHNLARMGKFSADRSIQEYAHNIWGIEPQPIDVGIFDRIMKEYHEVDRCRIF